MLTYTPLQDRPGDFLAAPGLTHEEFLRVLPAFGAASTACSPLDKTWHGHVRQRKWGGGATGRWAQVEDQWLFLLVSQQTTPLQTMPGWHFGLRPPQTHSWRYRVLPVLRRAFVALALAPERDASRVATSPRRREGAPAGARDGTERRRQRPTEAAQHTAHDRGKKKAHTDTHGLLSHEYTSQVVYRRPTVAGTTHDQRAADEADRVSPVHSPREKDTGLQGDEPAGLLTQQPQKSLAGKSGALETSCSILASPVSASSSNTCSEGGCQGFFTPLQA